MEKFYCDGGVFSQFGDTPTTASWGVGTFLVFDGCAEDGPHPAGAYHLREMIPADMQINFFAH
jgi:hypothetical protein